MHCALVVAVILPLLSQAVEETIKSTRDCNWKPHENTTDEKVSYWGAQLWRVALDSQDKLNVADALENVGDLQNWGLNNNSYYDVLVEFKLLQNVARKFRDHNITYTIGSDNFQKLIDEENLSVAESHAGHNLTWVKYHRLADIDSFVNYVTSTYSSICTVKAIGESIEGRLLRVLKISSGKPNNKAVWVDGGIHAREWISPATVTYIIKSLVENWKNESQAVRNIDWHFLPVLNPDGYEFAHTHDRLWRKNRRQNGTCPGTDLNRNFGSNWGGQGASACPCHDVYAGAQPFSEPESSAVQNYITVVQREALWKGFITMHSYGQIIFHSGGEDLKITGDKMTEEMNAVYGTLYEVESLEPTGGGSDNWAMEFVGIKYAYTLELRDLGKYGFVLPAFNIKPSGKEGLAAIRVLANAVDVS